MAGRGNPFSLEHSIGDSFETNFPKRPSPKGKVNLELDIPEYLYPVSNTVVDHLRRITRLCAKKARRIAEYPSST